MKITKIEIKNFRGFPGPTIYPFELPGGKNLLVYGENGSGKSSLFYALNQLFNIDPTAPSFGDLANLFAKDETGKDISDGFVTVHFDDSPPSTLTWSQVGGRPSSDPRLVDTAMRKGFLEYRSLLQTNFTTSTEDNLDKRLFRLAVEVLLARIPVPIGGTPRMLGEYWGKVSKPKNHHKTRLELSAKSINEFNQAFKAILPDVERTATSLLDFFVGHYMKLQLEFHDLVYDKDKRSIENQAIHLHVEFNGTPLTSHQTILNEARLSSLALALFLASVLLSNPAPGPGVTSPLKLLVLDDVLIGLDLCNRLPLLDILERHFNDYQVILMTYDLVWFELAQLRTQDSGDWVYTELFSNRIGNPGYEVPILKTRQSCLEKAKYHFGNHDYPAATVYARAAFETRLKNFCEKRGIPVIYNRDSRKVSSEQLWRAVTNERGGDGRCHVDALTKSCIESLRKVVLNPLSHSDANNITKVEVDAAIKTIEGLNIA